VALISRGRGVLVSRRSAPIRIGREPLVLPIITNRGILDMPTGVPGVHRPEVSNPAMLRRAELNSGDPDAHEGAT
jgi:hypothetical protein